MLGYHRYNIRFSRYDRRKEAFRCYDRFVQGLHHNTFLAGHKDRDCQWQLLQYRKPAENTTEHHVRRDQRGHIMDKLECRWDFQATMHRSNML